MAKSIGATLKLKDGNFFANLKKASKELGTFDSKTSDAIKTLKDFGDGVKEGAKNVLKIGTAVTGAITAIGGFSLKVGNEFSLSVISHTVPLTVLVLLWEIFYFGSYESFEP